MQSRCAGETAPSSQPPSPVPGTQRTFDHAQLIWHLIWALVTPYSPAQVAPQIVRLALFTDCIGLVWQQESLFRINPESQKGGMLRACTFSTVPEKLSFPFPYGFTLLLEARGTTLVAPIPCCTTHTKKLYPVFDSELVAYSFKGHLQLNGRTVYKVPKEGIST